MELSSHPQFGAGERQRDFFFRSSYFPVSAKIGDICHSVAMRTKRNNFTSG